MTKNISETQAGELILDSFKDLNCKIKLEDYKNVMKIKIDGYDIFSITRKEFSTLEKLEKTIARIRKSLN